MGLNYFLQICPFSLGIPGETFISFFPSMDVQSWTRQVYRFPEVQSWVDKLILSMGHAHRCYNIVLEHGMESMSILDAER